MDRYTYKDATGAFERLARALGKDTQPWRYRMGAGGKPPGQYGAVVGAWSLDYNPTYGGCVIHEICNEGGGITEPFGHNRRSPREFCAAVRFALDALDISDKAKEIVNDAT